MALLRWARATFSFVSVLSGYLPRDRAYLIFSALPWKGANADTILKQPIVLVCLMAMLLGNGAGAYDYVAMGSSLSNFPNYKGTAVALNVSRCCILFLCVCNNSWKGTLYCQCHQKITAGLSGSVIAQIKVAFFPNDGIGFLLFMAIICTLLPLCMTPFVNIVPHDLTLRAEVGSRVAMGIDGEKKQLMRGFVPEVVLLVFLLSLSILQVIYSNQCMHYYLIVSFRVLVHRVRMPRPLHTLFF
jgi:hypothetical protein